MTYPSIGIFTCSSTGYPDSSGISQSASILKDALSLSDHHPNLTAFLPILAILSWDISCIIWHIEHPSRDRASLDHPSGYPLIIFRDTSSSWHHLIMSSFLLSKMVSSLHPTHPHDIGMSHQLVEYGTIWQHHSIGGI